MIDIVITSILLLKKKNLYTIIKFPFSRECDNVLCSQRLASNHVSGSSNQISKLSFSKDFKHEIMPIYVITESNRISGYKIVQNTKSG